VYSVLLGSHNRNI